MDDNTHPEAGNGWTLDGFCGVVMFCLPCPPTSSLPHSLPPHACFLTENARPQRFSSSHRSVVVYFLLFKRWFGLHSPKKKKKRLNNPSFCPCLLHLQRFSKTKKKKKKKGQKPANENANSFVSFQAACKTKEKQKYRQTLMN